MKVIYPENHPENAPRGWKVRNSYFPPGDPRRYGAKSPDAPLPPARNTSVGKLTPVESENDTTLAFIGAMAEFIYLITGFLLIALAIIAGIAFAIAMFVKLVMFFI